MELETPTTIPTTTTTTEAAPAAPATSAPASPSPAVERPTDIRSLAKHMEGLDAATATEPPATLAAVPAVPPIAAPASPTTPGEPPAEKWPTILENARMKAATEAVAAYKQQYGWAETIPREQLQQWGAFANEVNSNPIAVIERLTQSVLNHPVWGPQLRSTAGRTLATAAPQPPQPDVQIVNAQGQVTGMTYSDARQAELLEWRDAQLLAKVQQSIQPFQQDRDQRIQADAQAREQQALNTAADQALARIEKILDGRTDLYPAMNALMAQHPTLDAYDAALQIRASHITPAAQAAAEAAVLATQQKKAAGNTANGAGPVATPKRPTNAKELADHMRLLEGA